MIKTVIDRRHMSMAQRDALGDRGFTPHDGLMSGGSAGGDQEKMLWDVSPAMAIAQNIFNIQPNRPGDQERSRLHEELKTWAEGPFKVEKPNGSWFHHMVQYDREHYGTLPTDQLTQPQAIVLENDWASTGIPNDGEWRLPFELTAWEMQLSGVRVIAIVECNRDGLDPMMILVYGRHKVWVLDDFRYQYVNGIFGWVKNNPKQEKPVLWRAPAQFMWSNIRATCIMLDARVASYDRVPVPRALTQSRQRTGKSPPKEHLVVRLIKRPHHRSPFGNHDADRSPQRGHWRQGTWVHYDDQDSGRVQYANDGGFVVSKTWRRWHFAGDPNNLIQKEYRV